MGEHVQYYGLGMDALDMVGTLLWLGHGCSRYRRLSNMKVSKTTALLTRRALFLVLHTVIISIITIRSSRIAVLTRHSSVSEKASKRRGTTAMRRGQQFKY